MLKIKGVISELNLVRDEYGNDYIEGIIDCSRSSGVIDSIYFRTEYSQMKYLRFCDCCNMSTPYNFSGSLRTYSTGIEYPRYRTVLYIRDYSVSLTDEDLNEFNGRLEILRVGDIRQTPNGSTIIDLVAFSSRYSGIKDKISVIAFGSTALFCSKVLKPGMSVKILGRLQSRMYLKDIGSSEPISVTINELVASYVTVIDKEEQ